MVAESAPALVVVGESDGGGLALLSTLVLGPRGGSEAANGASPIEGPGPHALRLDTKYYTVDVAATVHTLPDDDAAGDEAFGERPEAVVAVFDPTRDGSFARVTGWCEARDDSWSPEIRLLVCRYPTKGAMDAESASSSDAADDWAVDNGYEAVAVIASGGDDDDALELRGDEQGMRRVRAAIETVATLIGNVGSAVRLTTLITLVSGVLVLAGAIAAGRRRRIYDSVVLKVLGATRRDIVTAYILEYGLLGLVTAFIAAIVGSVTAWAVVTWLLGIDWTPEPVAVIVTAAIGTAITIGAGLIGPWRAMGQSAAPWLRNE